MIGLQVSVSSSVKPRQIRHVVLLAGQSNMVGRAPFDGGTSYPAGVVQWGREGADDGEIVAATSPLQHHDPGAGDMGLAVQFAIDYAAEHAEQDVLLVPVAKGATGFSDNQWNPGNPLCADAVARANAAMAAWPGARLVILWHQGERDSQSASDAAAYAARLDAMIAALREDITAATTSTPVVLGGLLPALAAKTGYDWADDVAAVIADTPNRIGYTAFASSDGLTSDQGTGAPSDGLHFDAPSLRTLGARYAAAVAAATDNVPEPAAWTITPGAASVTFVSVPAAPGAPAVEAGNASVTVS